ncbi:MAG: monovalent cation/H+ antiporter complex subunit F [Planctomycetota bacterium]|nr:monovalent cation/H+ antiporter complex subunit F [Planctomycetota bacterium]
MNAELLAALLVLGGAILAVVRSVLGPTFYDRVLAVNVFGTKAVMLLAIIGFIGDHNRFIDSGFLDIAILYGLINFIATVALLRFVESGRYNS